MARLLCIFAVVIGATSAQTPPAPAPEPDTLLFMNGEKLIGHLVKAAGATVTFKSDSAGEITVDWAKVKEIRSGAPFAVIPKDIELSKKEALAQIPRGTVTVADQNIALVGAPGGTPTTVPVANSAYVVSNSDFVNVTEGKHGFFKDWKGGLTGGLAVVESTQKSQTYNLGIILNRVEPTVDWLTLRNRTTAIFNLTYGKTTQAGTPDIKTEIYHAELERDEYLSKRLFVFGRMGFDHNFSQGLDLQQVYGGGLGFTVVKSDRQQLDLKASVDYIRQAYADSSANKNLIGSTFGDTYFYKFPRGFVFNEALTFIPAWNDTSAWSFNGTAGLIFPAYKNFSFSVTAADSYFNQPPPAFRKNSFQITAGITYVIK
jgi:hypothetical protein